MTAIKAKRQLSSLSHAKSNFIASVQEGIAELMNRCGYSRERATHTLLRELGRGGDSPTDHEVSVGFVFVVGSSERDVLGRGVEPKHIQDQSSTSVFSRVTVTIGLVVGTLKPRR
jgi:hypothetical protein